MAVMSNKIGVELLGILGIDGSKVISAVIKLHVNEPVTVDVTRYAEHPETGKLEQFKARYHLRAMPQPDSAWADITTLCSSSREFAQGIKVD